MSEQGSSISNFKRFLYRIVLPSVVILGIASVILNHLFEKKIILSIETDGAYKVNRILRETHADEIPIIGSSRAEMGIIPDSLGTSYFNYGLPGAAYSVALFFMEEECRKKKNKPWIISNLDLEGLRYKLGNMAAYIPNATYRPVKDLLGDSYRFYYQVPLIKYYGLFETYLSAYVNNRMEITKFVNKGAVIEKKIVTDKLFLDFIRQRENTPGTFVETPELVKRLLNLIATNPDRYFIFVIAPYHPSYFDSFTNLEEARRFLNMLNSMKNVRVFDFSRMPLPDSMFFNTSHLNFKGAIKYSRQLKDSLASIGVH